MTPDQLSDAFLGALRELAGTGALALADGLPERVAVHRPRSRTHGDYASAVALRLAGRAGLPPRELAGLLAARLEGASGIQGVEVAGPGFLNVRLAADVAGEVLAGVVAAGAAYGSSDLLGKRVDLVGADRPVRMSGSADDEATVDDLVEAIGLDAARYALARCPTDTPVVIDLDVWSRAGTGNPVHDVQYAHARVSSILRHADALGVVPADHPALLTHERERDLLFVLADFPRVVAVAATSREPHRVARHLEDTASAFDRFTDACRVLPVGDEEPEALHCARLRLVQATRVVLANGLELLGVCAPERM